MSNEYGEYGKGEAIKELSPREVEIVDLCVLGMTNEGIAHALNISLGTVNTYWLRIKRKVGGKGRADTISRIVKYRAQQSLREAAEMVAQCEQSVVELRPALAFFRLAMDQIQDLVWATDPDLTVQVVESTGQANQALSTAIEAGQTIYDIFGTNDDSHPAIAAHLAALRGETTDIQLTGELNEFSLKVSPWPVKGARTVGCLSILSATC